MKSTSGQRAAATRGSFPRPNAVASARLPPRPRRAGCWRRRRPTKPCANWRRLACAVRKRL